MSRLDFDRDVSVLSRFADGFYNGVKWTICYSFTFGIYHSKQLQLDNNTTFRREYYRHMTKASVFFPLLMSSSYGMRQLVLMNRDLIISRLHSLHPYFRKNRALVDITIYMAIYIPLGTALNYLNSGRVLRGTFTMTMMMALLMRTIDSSFPQESHQP